VHGPFTCLACWLKRFFEINFGNYIPKSSDKHGQQQIGGYWEPIEADGRWRMIDFNDEASSTMF
jgi:hypothetical protein